MTISELITNLENLRAEHGDLDVIFIDSEYDMCEIDIECEKVYCNSGRKVVKLYHGNYTE